MRRLVVCADGTWNSDDANEDGSGLTNVYKTAAAVAPADERGIPQLVHYQKGVGTDKKRWWDKYFGGGLGYGLSQNVQECYHFLVRNYEPGDEIFLFGFSRGAYTVRSLGGLLRNCGLLKREHEKRVEEAYERYRDRDNGRHPNAPEMRAFRRAFSHEPKVKMMGVWDTVGALGLPTNGLIGEAVRRKYEFHDVRLSTMVEHAYHALAIDEQRRPFAPSIWGIRESDRLAHEQAGQKIEQRWFAGVHSNVGGGYSDCKLSDISLRWMLRKADECGLALVPGALDRLDCDCKGTLYDSFGKAYEVLGPHRRAIGAQTLDPQTGEPMLTYEVVDSSVFERWFGPEIRPEYRPRNLDEYWSRFPDQRPQAPRRSEQLLPTFGRMSHPLPEIR
jgi:uncharacterized protein (DUF2235 family)